MILDMRSVDAGELQKLADKVQAIIEREPGKGLTTEIELLGERPAGSQSPDHPLIQLAVDACRWVGYEPELQSSSTDLNIPVSFGIPGVCLGTSIGEGTHTVNEQIHIEPFKDGVAHVTRMLIDATSWVATGKGTF